VDWLIRIDASLNCPFFRRRVSAHRPFFRSVSASLLPRLPERLSSASLLALHLPLACIFASPEAAYTSEYVETNNTHTHKTKRKPNRKRLSVRKVEEEQQAAMSKQRVRRCCLERAYALHCTIVSYDLLIFQYRIIGEGKKGRERGRARVRRDGKRAGRKKEKEKQNAPSPPALGAQSRRGRRALASPLLRYAVCSDCVHAQQQARTQENHPLSAHRSWARRCEPEARALGCRTRRE
jgi:hypothetical protein